MRRRGAPLVLFQEFGSDSLVFESRFWIRMRRLTDRLLVQSEIRFELDDRFRAAGIAIAFPQRDVHLDTVSPVEIRLVRDPDQKKE